MCVICGFVGCGRYREGHAIKHWKETQHCYSLELETQRVWDYVGDNYVHRLIQSKTDGKLVEFDCVHMNDTCEICECSADSGISEALFSTKIEAISDEYNLLLATQLENQRKYFESLLLEVKEETERQISEAIERGLNLKLQKIQSKLDKCTQERRFLDEINENLVENQEMWKAKILEVEEREQTAVKSRDEKIQDLEEQLQDLLARVEAHSTLEKPPESASNEIKKGTVSPGPSESSSGGNSSRRAPKSNRRRT